MITTAGLTRFWIGTALIAVAGLAGVVTARSALGESAPWPIGVGAAAVTVLACVALWRRRVALEPDAMRVDLPRYDAVSVIVGLVLFGQTLFVLFGLMPASERNLVAGFWQWSLPATVLIGVLLVFSLGDYAP